MKIVIRLPVINDNPSDGNSPTTPSPPPLASPPQQHQFTPLFIDQGPNVENHPPSSPQENETLEEVMKKCTELVTPLLNFHNWYSILDVIAKWSNSVQDFFDKLVRTGQTNCPDIGSNLEQVAYQIEEVAKIVEEANSRMLEFAKQIRVTLKDPAFERLKKLQKEHRRAVRREAKMEKAYQKWSKKPVDKERIPMVKCSKAKFTKVGK